MLKFFIIFFVKGAHAREFRPRGFTFFPLTEGYFLLYSWANFHMFFPALSYAYASLKFLLCGWHKNLNFLFRAHLTFSKKLNSSQVPDGAYPDNI